MKVSFRLGTILTSFVNFAVGLRGTRSQMKDRNECLEFVPRYPDDNLISEPCISMWLSPRPRTDRESPANSRYSMKIR